MSEAPKVDESPLTLKVEGLAQVQKAIALLGEAMANVKVVVNKEENK